MPWTISSSLDDFRARAGGFLAAHPAANTVLLTITDRLAARGPHYYGDGVPVFGWWRAEPDGPVAGAFLRTPPFALRLGLMPESAAAELATELATRSAAGPAGGAALTGAAGGAAATLAFGAAWAAATGTTSTVRTNERLYRLGELADPPRPPSGRSRLAGAADRELLIRWFTEFAEAVDIRIPDVATVVDDRTAAGQLHLWEDGGRPVAVAGASAVIAGMSRIGPVYTPADARGRGYASGVTAAASVAALDRGAGEVLLYTDLANPTSNSIYQQIGYRPVEDCVELAFGG
ncbi:GNAT family N-acetyltransferase [Kitasatospora purpeofusca]|uniref:GNAT family N-acetyltransferase n=1 Tax=Kitasatospora purpeofusca TaxID=67352 RepID=UPI0022528D72|nr:GNAT family N-acetyltransferase [Kitasatospora purpeofusca]MCX4754627.1 GNAT family N-acetyltransferase [Kitasatospora purpeofusca]WSR34035.1 GNAT family N-acetyltransferase [Kitasatospora purpeofusca]